MPNDNSNLTIYINLLSEDIHHLPDYINLLSDDIDHLTVYINLLSDDNDHLTVYINLLSEDVHHLPEGNYLFAKKLCVFPDAILNVIRFDENNISYYYEPCMRSYYVDIIKRSFNFYTRNVVFTNHPFYERTFLKQKTI